MDYQPILSKLEEQKQNVKISTKIFRYTGLIQAIEFFSQKLNLEQIVDSAFDFVNELLTLEKSSVFILQGDKYVLKKSKGSDSRITIVENSRNLENLAMLNGSLINDRENLEKYFNIDVLNSYSVTTLIPLIIGNVLYGFIFLSNKTTGDFDSDDLIISEALMRLTNNAIENYKRYEELQNVNKELDEKIFNLFAINHSSKALLSELSLGTLYSLAVDVFSELTQSSITGFVLYEERSEEYVLKAFKDVFNIQTGIEFSLLLNKAVTINMNKVIIDISSSEDVSYFNALFTGGLEKLKLLNAQYVVLLLKNNKLLGFVTLGETVTANHYKKSMFELIESLASATYIAINNAQLFKQVNNQKKLIQAKLENLVSLNNLMKSINSSVNMETLLELTVRTLEVSFDVEKAIVALYDREKEVFNIANLLGVETSETVIRVNPIWKKVFEGDAVYEATEDGVGQYISAGLLRDLGNVPGLLIVPIYIDRVEIELLGAIIIFKYRKAPINDEENMLTVETIAGHISPVISNLNTLELQMKACLPNYIEMFKCDLNYEIEGALDLDFDLNIIHITDTSVGVFQQSDIIKELRGIFTRVYPFSNKEIFVMSNEKDGELENKISKAVGDKDIAVRVFALRKDFNSYEDFFKLF